MKFKFKINIPFLGHLIDTELEVSANEKGIPHDKFWRNRLRDSKVDNCITVVSPQPVAASKKVNVEGK
jgi:hypothetical protein